MVPLPALSPLSPCTHLCKMDKANGLCLGCFRTLDEIAHWSRASDQVKIAVLAQIEKRRTCTTFSA